MKIGYIVHNLNDPAVERRCRMFERGGAAVRLAGFCRDEGIAPAVAARTPHLLGRTHDARMARRAIDTLRAAAFDRSAARYLADCDVLVARNLEQLAIACSVARDRPVVYECLDIHRLLTGRGGASTVIRAIEARLLQHVDLVLTSSPAFVRHHFADRPLRAPVDLIENKLLVDDAAAAIASPAPPVLPVRIGWFGMLRCRRTLDALTALAERAAGQVEILIAGRPSPAELPDLAVRAAATPGVSFVGAYSYADLPALYGRCHFTWAIDWFEEGLNSDWLLPNRLYEALAYGAVPIALSHVETGRWLAARDCGLVIDDADEALARLGAIQPTEVAHFQRQAVAVDRRDLLADDADCRALVARIGSVCPAWA